MLYRCGGGFWARKVAHCDCVVERALHDFNGELGVFRDLLVGCRPIQGHGIPKVKLVEDVQSCNIWYSLQSVSADTVYYLETTHSVAVIECTLTRALAENIHILERIFKLLSDKKRVSR